MFQIELNKICCNKLISAEYCIKLEKMEIVEKQENGELKTADSCRLINN